MSAGSDVCRSPVVESVQEGVGSWVWSKQTSMIQVYAKLEGVEALYSVLERMCVYYSREVEASFGGRC